MEENSNMISMTDENGSEVEMEFLDLIEYEGAEYIVLLPPEKEDEDNVEVVILRVEPDPEDEEMESYVGVEDEAVLSAVFEIFKEHFADEFNFV